MNIHSLGALLEGSLEKPSGTGQERADHCQTNKMGSERRNTRWAEAESSSHHRELSQAEPANRERTRQACGEEPLANSKLLRTGHTNWGRLNVLRPGASNIPNPQMILLNQLGLKKKYLKQKLTCPLFSPLLQMK